MLRKYFIILVLSLLSLTLLSCQQQNLDDEVIVAEGLSQAVIYKGQTFDFMENVTFTSSTRSDITASVTLSETIDLNTLGVSILKYQTYYENSEVFFQERRVVVLNAPDSDTLISNGDFSSTLNWDLHSHASYPSEVLYIIDPDLLRMQVIIRSASDNIEWPHIKYPPISLDSTKTYTFSLLVSGTHATTFAFDVVETTSLGEVYEITNQIINPISINVGLNSAGMQLLSFDFTPLMSSSNAKLRLMFGGTVSQETIIYLDNLRLVENN